VGRPDLSSWFRDDGAQRRGYSRNRKVITLTFNRSTQIAASC
jgi:hypothetical protein